MAFNNQGGTVEVDSGNLQMPIQQGGTFNVAAGALLDLGDGGDFLGTYTGGGGGAVRISQGTLYTDSTTGATFNFPGALLQWTGGTIGADQRGHLFTNAGTMTLSGDSDKQSYAQFFNTGTMIQTGAGNFNVGEGNSGGRFTNDTTGSYDLQSDAAIGKPATTFSTRGCSRSRRARALPR